MALRPPPLKAQPSILADWVELRTLADPEGVFELRKLKRLWDTNRESEDTDLERHHLSEQDTEFDGVSGEDEEAFFTSLIVELAERMTNLKGSYPFEFSGANRTRFKFVGTTSVGSAIYLFCLFLSNEGNQELLDGKWNPAVTDKTRDLFQACSTLAAAGHICGCAISFGWPRPYNNPPFLKKLQEVYAQFGEGTVVTQPKAGASPWVKDEEIDIIAWKPRSDGAPGKFYLLAQVASGENWEGKSVLAGIKYFHRTWFTTPPASQPTAAILIPHLVPQVGVGTRKDRMDLITGKFGHVIDRMLLPEIAEIGLQLANDLTNNYCIERKEDMPVIMEWVNAQAETLKSTNFLPL